MGVLAPTNGPVKVLTHTGPPVTADGIFTKGSQAMDTSDVLYVCTASGTPGTWVSVSGGGGGSVSSVFTRTGAVVAASGDYSVGQVTGAAPLASPALTGTPTAPTASVGDSSTQLATDAFVAAAIAPLAPLASPALTGSPTAPTQTPGDNTTKLATDAFVAAAIAPLAPLASPALTGSPTAPTQSPGDNSTKIATDAFVAAAIVAARPIGALVSTSETSNSTSYANLTTPGPAVTVTTLTTALVLLSASLDESGTDFIYMSFAVSGASTIAAVDARAAVTIVAGPNSQHPTESAAFWVTGLTAGANTFTAKYRVGGASTGTWANRNITVIPGPT